MICIGPSVQPHGRVKNMLHAMNDERAGEIIRQSHNALHTQQAWPVKFPQHVEKEIKAARIKRLVRAQTMRTDARIMAVHIMAVIVMVMIVAVVMVVMVVMIVLSLLDIFGIEPARYIGRLARRIIEARIEKIGGRCFINQHHLRSRIERMQALL